MELAPNGHARLVPVVIMIDGQFYDASAYKASPVPMALDSGIVYEAERAGASQGLFTVSGALQGPNNTWLGAGTWQPAGSIPKSITHRAESVPRGMESDEGPPVLHRRDAGKPKPSEPTPPPATPAPAPPATAPAGPPPVAPAPPTANAPAAAAPAPAASPAPEEVDPNRPVLRRGKPSAMPEEPVSISAVASTKTSAPAAASSTPSKNAAIQILPAISDAGGPEPHSYAYPMKPADEEPLHKKMLAMAADEVRDRARQLAAEVVGAPSPARTSSQRGRTARPAAPPQPNFDDVQLHVFDLSSSNEAVLVLTATAHMPIGKNDGPAGLQYMLTLVARQDIYGELHKVFSNVTDTQHLDVLPRYEFIDAVDADGDGRGELLFRKVSDAGSAFGIYRVIGQQWWPLFEGSPGQ